MGVVGCGGWVLSFSLGGGAVLFFSFWVLVLFVLVCWGFLFRCVLGAALFFLARAAVRRFPGRAAVGALRFSGAPVFFSGARRGGCACVFFPGCAAAAGGRCVFVLRVLVVVAALFFWGASRALCFFLVRSAGGACVWPWLRALGRRGLSARCAPSGRCFCFWLLGALLGMAVPVGGELLPPGPLKKPATHGGTQGCPAGTPMFTLACL